MKNFKSIFIFFYILSLYAPPICRQPASSSAAGREFPAVPYFSAAPSGAFDDAFISVLVDKKKYLSEIRIVPGGSFRETATGRKFRYSTEIGRASCRERV